LRRPRLSNNEVVAPEENNAQIYFKMISLDDVVWVNLTNCMAVVQRVSKNLRSITKF
jgi:hypothetical protein